MNMIELVLLKRTLYRVADEMLECLSLSSETAGLINEFVEYCVSLIDDDKFSHHPSDAQVACDALSRIAAEYPVQSIPLQKVLEEARRQSVLRFATKMKIVGLDAQSLMLMQESKDGRIPEVSREELSD